MRTMKTPINLKTSSKNRIATKKLSRYISLDRIVSNQFNGTYTSPFKQNTIRYNVRKIDSYCRARGIKPENLSKEELKNFVLS